LLGDVREARSRHLMPISKNFSGIMPHAIDFVFLSRQELTLEI
jgi:hypothetical protein